MSQKQNPDVEEQAKGEEVRSRKAETEAIIKQPDQPRFKEKAGSVFPKKRRPLINQIFDRALHQLCLSTTSSGTLFPEETSNAVEAKRVHPNCQKHGSD